MSVWNDTIEDICNEEMRAIGYMALMDINRYLKDIKEAYSLSPEKILELKRHYLETVISVLEKEKTLDKVF